MSPILREVLVTSEMQLRHLRSQHNRDQHSNQSRHYSTFTSLAGPKNHEFFNPLPQYSNAPLLHYVHGPYLCINSNEPHATHWTPAIQPLEHARALLTAALVIGI